MVNPPRVLQILSSTQLGGGVETLVMNVYRNIDRERVQFDFITHLMGPPDFDAEMIAMGARVFEIPLMTKIGYRAYMRRLTEIMKENGPYRAVHSHLDYQAWLGTLAGKRNGVNIRVCHAHMDRSSDRSLQTALKLLFGRVMIPRSATALCACSVGAARSVFGRHMSAPGRTTVINNGIDTKRFSTGLTEEYAAKMRRLLSIGPSQNLFLQVGRFVPSKNYAFTLELAGAIKESGLPWVIACAGTGPQLDEFTARAGKEGLGGQIRFLGASGEVHLLMQMADALIFPSLFEGLGIVAVEAQAAGLPVLISETAFKHEVDMGLALIHPLPVNGGSGPWMEKLRQVMGTPKPDPVVCAAAVDAGQFGIDHTVSQFMSLYQIT